MVYSAGNITEFNGIFDTQIAHRMCYEDEYGCNSNGTKNNSISLNELLKINFGINVSIKDEIHELMSKSPYLWKQRPIPYKLNYYAGSDVLYLPKLYYLFKDKIEKKIVKKITMEDIFNECKKYLNYLSINKNIKNYNKMNLVEGTKIKGLIKNFQNYCVYIQLNIGYIGIVDKPSTVQNLKEKYKLGDIIDLIINKIDNKKKRMILDIEEDKINDMIKLEEEYKLDIGNNNKGSINNANTINLVHGLNINKESFFPKSYNRNDKKNNNETKSNNNLNQYQYYNYGNNNKNYYNNYYENYYKENDAKKNYQNSNYNYAINNDILNGNYNGLFYDYEGNYYYYNNNDENNDDNNDDDNSNSYFYTLKPFPK